MSPSISWVLKLNVFFLNGSLRIFRLLLRTESFVQRKKKYRHAIIIIICKIVDVICKTEIRKLMLMNKFILISLRTNRKDLTWDKLNSERNRLLTGCAEAFSSIDNFHSVSRRAFLRKCMPAECIRRMGIGEATVELSIQRTFIVRPRCASNVRAAVP